MSFNANEIRKRLKSASGKRRLERATYYVGDGDQNTDAASETGEQNTIFIRRDPQSNEFEVAYLDPSSNNRLFFYNTPVIVERRGRIDPWRVVGIDTQLFNQVFGAGIDTAIGYGGNIVAHNHTTGADGSQLNAGLVFNGGAVQVVYGGTGTDNTTVANGALMAYDSTTVMIKAANLTAEGLLVGDGVNAPNSLLAGAIGDIVRSTDGTTWTASDAPIALEQGGTETDLSGAPSGRLIQASTGAPVTNLKCNFGASAAPAVTDDSASGYAVASEWYDTTHDKAYDCLDAAVGAAVWIERGVPSGAMSSFNLAGTSGTPQTIVNADTLTVAAGTGITTTAGATDTVTVALDVPVVASSGGTGRTTLTANALLAGNGTGTVNLIGGTDGNVLQRVSGVWTDVPSGSVGAALIATDGTTTVNPTSTLRFPAGSITNNGGGEAEYVTGAMTGLVLAATAVTSNTTLTSAYFGVYVDATSSAITITLPAVASNIGRMYSISKTDSSTNTVTIDGNASETINGATTLVISAQNVAYTLQALSTGWRII